MTSSQLEIHSAEAPPLRVASSSPARPMQPPPSHAPKLAAAQSALADAHRRLVDRGWTPQGVAYDPAGPDAHITVAQLLADVAAWRGVGRETLFQAVTVDGRPMLQAYTRPTDLNAVQRAMWARETALPFDLDTYHMAEGAEEAHRLAETEGAC